ncbi:MAG: aldehyde ferredoxin oxidoreductase family protein [Candidatus Heimdallarchaeota archaeon]
MRVDLSSGSIKEERLDRKWVRGVVGGRAANTKRLAEELNPKCAPLSPENVLIFGVGPLTGSILPASAYFIVTAKSPLTGILGDSAAGGIFGPELKFAGFDQIIITGQAEELVYLIITEEGIELVPCSELKDKKIIETTAAIRKKHRNYDIQVAAIGAAGERLVLFSTIVSSGNRVNGRTGMGAVMGSKNLKAIAVRGFQFIEFAEPLTLLEETQKIARAILAHNEYQKRYAMGTTMLMSDLNRLGILPTKHFQEGVCDYIDSISGEMLARTYKVKNKACFNCNLHCSRYYLCGEVEAEGPEYETLSSFTSKIGNNKLSFALEMNEWLNQNGLDSISTSEVIAWLMECLERGLLSPEELGDIELHWGAIDEVREVIRLITFREGLGDKLALGAKRFSEQFNEDVQKLVMHVKGLDLINGDPRGIKAYGLTYAIASRGGDHLRAEPFFELTGRKEEAKKRFGTEKAADRLAEEGKAALVVYSEKIALLTDSLTMCKNIGLCMDILNFENTASLLTAATGINYSPTYLQKIMNDSINLQRKLNEEFGLKPEDDTLPERFLKEPLKRGPTKGSLVDIERMVKEYYQLHNWKT